MYIDCLYFRVAGVSFNNEDGSSRQRYISKLHPDDPLGMESFDYEGSTAFHILDSDEHCIGNLPKEHIQFILDHYNQGHRIVLYVNEILGLDEEGKRIEGYNLGVEVALDVYDDSVEEKSSTDSAPAEPVLPAPAERPKKKTGRIMIAFGIICAINAVMILNPLTAVLSVVLLYFGIRRYRNYKSSK